MTTTTATAKRLYKVCTGEDDIARTKMNIDRNGYRLSIDMDVSNRKTVEGCYKVFCKAFNQAVEDGVIPAELAPLATEFDCLDANCENGYFKIEFDGGIFFEAENNDECGCYFHLHVPNKQAAEVEADINTDNLKEEITMKTIETKTVANVNEIVDIVNELNYKGETFEYESTSTFDDNSKGRFFGSVRKNGNPGGFSIIEFVVDGELKAVRFFNHDKGITVDFKLGDFAPSYDRFDNVIEIPADQPANITAADTDGSEDDAEDDNPFDFLPTLDELNDVEIANGEPIDDTAAETDNGYVFTVYKNGDACNTECATLGDVHLEVINFDANFAPYVDTCNGWELKTATGKVIIKGEDAPDFTEIVLAVAATLSANEALQILENELARLNSEVSDLGKEIDFGLFLYGASPEEVEDSFTKIADNRAKIAAIAKQTETLKAAVACDPRNQTTADTDGTEDDTDDDIFGLLPDLDELNDVDSEPEAEDKVITAEVKPEDNFSAKLAELQAKRDAAERLLQNFLSDTAGNLATQLHELNNTLDYSIELVTERGYSFTVSDFDNIYVDSFGDGKTFAFTDWRSRKYATYDTPAQVEKVIGLLKAAIVRGDEKFTFPTVDELRDADKTAMADSLTRAMTIALENFQAFCRAKNLTAAEGELKLYNICRKALSELWRPAIKKSRG